MQEHKNIPSNIDLNQQSADFKYIDNMFIQMKKMAPDFNL